MSTGGQFGSSFTCLPVCADDTRTTGSVESCVPHVESCLLRFGMFFCFHNNDDVTLVPTSEDPLFRLQCTFDGDFSKCEISFIYLFRCENINRNLLACLRKTDILQRRVFNKTTIFGGSLSKYHQEINPKQLCILFYTDIR